MILPFTVNQGRASAARLCRLGALAVANWLGREAALDADQAEM